MLRGFRAEMLCVREDPLHAGPEAAAHHADGLLVVEDGLVVACGAYGELAERFGAIGIERITQGLLVPGFIDVHAHYPQTEQLAAYGVQLLDWLDQHIFPAEIAFADRAHADRVAGLFLDELLRHGTTTALVFATVHEASVDALFDQALARNMRIISGKVLMDRGPPDLCDTAAEGARQTEALIRRWRGRGRLGYAVTPRFALTSSPEQLASAGEVLRAHPDVLLHTHLAENRAEVGAVTARFPEARDYVDVYDRFGLVGPRSVFAHAIHMDHRSMGRLGEAGAGIAFCPTSNLFLGSGLFDLKLADEHGVKVGVGTDVGAGTSFSVLRTLGEAYKVCQLQGVNLDPFRALYMAAAGGARVLGLQDRIGALQPGQEADFVVLDGSQIPLFGAWTVDRPLRQRLFALQVLGDDRAIARTYIAGQLAYARTAPGPSLPAS
jgi:guanine deaminase